jgi:hypothetical protein
VSDDPLDQVNRFAISIVALVLAFLALLVALLAWGASDGTIGRIEDFASYLRDHDGNDGKIVVSLLALFVVLIMATVMIIELTPSPVQRMRLRNVKSGEGTLTTTDIAGRVEEEVRAVEHVAWSKATVAAHGNKVEVVLDLHVDAAADLARTADESCRRAHVLIEENMGIPLTKRPRARIHYRELRLGGAGSAPPQAPARPPTGWERPAGDEGTTSP